MPENWQDHHEPHERRLGNVGGSEPFTAGEDRQWATLAHFGGILGCLPSLLVYLSFKDRGPFTAQESKEALNFTLPPTLAALFLNLLSFIPVVGSAFSVLATLVWVALAVMSVAAGIEVNRGQPFRYRFNLRWIK